jgi:hypothetical protein
MANNDSIGITFMPSADGQAQGQQNAGDTGASGSLSDAFKILSLRLPQTVGPRSLASERLLTARGSAGANSFNPHAAVFEALIRALIGQGPTPNLASGRYQPGLPGGTRSGNQTQAPTPDDVLTVPTPRIIPGVPTPPPSPRTSSGDLGSAPTAAGSADFDNPRNPADSYY